ncbi:hypothetical protein, partial [Streptomyces sp. NPDC056689]|uniref:hypothetical protein n=1 Tax=Streptomyces sp. NPDC056689 TaxID=3345911 RepID=UPI00368F92BC
RRHGPGGTAPAARPRRHGPGGTAGASGYAWPPASSDPEAGEPAQAEKEERKGGDWRRKSR